MLNKIKLGLGIGAVVAGSCLLTNLSNKNLDKLEELDSRYENIWNTPINTAYVNYISKRLVLTHSIASEHFRVDKNSKTYLFITPSSSIRWLNKLEKAISSIERNR